MEERLASRSHFVCFYDAFQVRAAELNNQLQELIEIIYSACTNSNNMLYIGEMKATTKINNSFTRI